MAAGAGGRSCIFGHETAADSLRSNQIEAEEKQVKKKAQEGPIVDPRVAASARRLVFEPKPRKTFDCRVCGSEGASEDSEGLCWVCRRLKISAWRDVEVQLPMNE